MKTFLYVAGSLVVLVVLFAFVPAESYNYFCPSIDTEYASGFSERAFAKVTQEMPASEVTQLLGEPLYKSQHTKGEEWWYTSEGKCSWGDFAWLGRSVRIQESKVVLVGKRVYHD